MPGDRRVPLNKHCKTNGFLLNLSSGMQTVIQVIATGTGSLRNKIMSDAQLEKKFGFIKVWHKQPGRPHGWAKIHSARDVHGAINLEWHARSRTLICRVVTKLGNSRTQSLVILSIICWRAIKAVFLQSTSCVDESGALRLAASLDVNYSTVTLFARLRGLSTSRPSSTAR